MSDLIEEVSQGKWLMQKLRLGFSRHSQWPNIERSAGSILSELPPNNSTENKKKILNILKSLKEMLILKNIDIDETKFIDEEIDICRYTNPIALCNEKDFNIEPEEIEKYARLKDSNDGLVSIHKPYNYEQLKRLSKGVYHHNGDLKFYVSPDKRLSGRVISEMFEYPQNVVVATLIMPVKDDEDKQNTISFFGEKYSTTKYVKVKELEVRLYLYNYITDTRQEVILMSTKELGVGDYIITGTLVNVDDLKSLTDSMRLQTKTPFLFVQQAEEKIIKYKDMTEFMDVMYRMKVSKENMFDYPMAIYIEKKDIYLKALHPEWFKWLIWSWLLHSKQGVENEYPMQLMMIGPPDSGKSLLLNRLHAKSKEIEEVFSGSGSTLKCVVPSFKYKPAKIGYLAMSNRFAFLDEFLRCIVNSRDDRFGNRDESLAMMNDLLEHQKRKPGSGVSSVRVNMTARAIASSNPVRDVKDMPGLLSKFEGSFLSRWMIYFQSESHVSMIKNVDDSQLEEYHYRMNTNDWLSILDFMQSVESEFDWTRVRRIYEDQKELLSADLLRHYENRHKHHIKCLMDGLIKARCLFSNDSEIVAIEDDYEMLERVWVMFIRSWNDTKDLSGIPLEDKAKYMPEKCQYIFDKLCEYRKPMKVMDLKEVTEKEMDNYEFRNHYIILKEQEMIIEYDDEVKPYYMKEETESGKEKEHQENL